MDGNSGFKNHLHETLIKPMIYKTIAKDIIKSLNDADITTKQDKLEVLEMAEQLIKGYDI